jgi:A/G-specific adenine glycosylase
MHFLDKFLKTDYQLDKIARQLLDWYGHNKRNLPWRTTNDPYKIWLSEIILQQTRVNQGLNYYLAFVKKYPKVGHLASDSIENVLKLWQGLGYYSKARNLHETAQLIQNEYKGKFPASFKELLALKGVGLYTAAAISSISFDEKVAVLDGNVFRVLSRYFGIYTPIDSSAAKKEFFELANSLVPSKNAGDYNQAIMELGALVCTPRNPLCNECPLNKGCYALQKKVQHDLPVKAKKTKVTQRAFHYFLLVKRNKFFIHQRTQKDIWQNLFQLPLIEKNDDFEKQVKKLSRDFGLKKSDLFKDEVYSAKHVLSHQVLLAKFYFVNIKTPVPENEYKAIRLVDFQEYPVSRLTEKFFETAFFKAKCVNGK